jgi:hypothetical protein
MAAPSSLRIIVTGLAGLYPVGGVAWDYLQYVVGLHELGHDVYYHEDTWSWPYHPLEATYTPNGDYSAHFLSDFFIRYAPELRTKWHYLHLHETSFGMGASRFDEVARTADVFLNVSGACIIPEQLSPRCLKIFLDTDPGYNQVMLSERFSWSENVERWSEAVLCHDRYFTYAENIHNTDCLIPKLGLSWQNTRMPIVRQLWQTAASPPPKKGPWTTVMTWNAFKGKLLYEGVEYASKGTEFEKIISLPTRVSVPLKVAVGGVKAPLKRLSQEGWEAVDGPSASITPEQYQQFIVGSRGECSPAKQVYVAMRSGWFSSRSACYLAAGRPVVVQDTGFAAAFPVGEGIVPFSCLQEAVTAIQEVEGNYPRHARAATGIAAEYFDADKVLSRLVSDAFSSYHTSHSTERSKPS